MSSLGLDIRPLDSKLENLKNNQVKKHGGPRPNSGRKEGKFSLEKIEKIKTEQYLKDRITKNVDKILNAQLSIATGLQYLFKIVTTKVGKKEVRSKPILVVDPKEIEAYLDYAENDAKSVNTDTEYFYITAERPNQQAIANLFDRAFGRPKESLTLDGNLTLETVITEMKKDRGGIKPL